MATHRTVFNHTTGKIEHHIIVGGNIPQTNHSPKVKTEKRAKRSGDIQSYIFRPSAVRWTNDGWKDWPTTGTERWTNDGWR